jgi:hypothetical protein
MVKGVPPMVSDAPSFRPLNVPTIGAVLVMIGNVSPGPGVKPESEGLRLLSVILAVPVTAS